ncbi:MAG: hypothetical protein K8R74_16190 [Bacteroidales bacterium]|nr:hypothetical protein [Bacteroidales bacterium]
MKKLLITLFVGLLLTSIGYSQTKSESKLYSTTGWEMIFSFADIDYKGEQGNNVMRWAPVINIQSALNYDVAKSFGLFTGIALRNVGYIMDNYVDREEHQVKKKFRTYNVGLPLGIKVGNLKKFFVYAGYDVEFAFLYKEKTFKDGNKDKLSRWFWDEKVNRWDQFQHGLIVGMQFPYGFNLKFKYYFSEFHNQGYSQQDGYKPYAGLQSNVFYFSLNFSMFKNAKFYYEEEKKGSEYY